MTPANILFAATALLPPLVSPMRPNDVPPMGGRMPVIRMI